MRLWGFDGYPAAPGYIECVKLAWLLCILCAVPIATAVDPEEHVKKEDLPASEWSELLVFTGVVCVVATGLWEIVKLILRKISKGLQNAKKERTRERIRETAAVETERELRRVEDESTLTRRRSSSRSRVPESPRPSPERAPATPPSSPMPQISPTSSFPSWEHTRPTTPEGQPHLPPPSDRRRVTRDMLSLLQVSELQKALRLQGLLVSGVKEDLVNRLSEVSLPSAIEIPSYLPTERQMRYVLWIWRHHNLKGKVLLRWEDVSSRRSTSAWIEVWKHGGN